MTEEITFEAPKLGTCEYCHQKQARVGSGGFWICGSEGMIWICTGCKHSRKIRSHPVACEWCNYGPVKWHQGNTYTCPRCESMGIGQVEDMAMLMGKVPRPEPAPSVYPAPELGSCEHCHLQQTTAGRGGYWIWQFDRINHCDKFVWVCHPCQNSRGIRSYPVACEWCKYDDVIWHQFNTYECPRCKALGIGQASSE